MGESTEQHPFQDPTLRAKAMAARKRNREIQKMAELEGMRRAHQQYGADIFNAKVELIRSLRTAGLDENGSFDPTRLSKGQLDAYITSLKWFEDKGFGKDSAETGNEDTVARSVVAILSEMKKRVENG